MAGQKQAYNLKISVRLIFYKLVFPSVFAYARVFKGARDYFQVFSYARVLEGARGCFRVRTGV